GRGNSPGCPHDVDLGAAARALARRESPADVGGNRGRLETFAGESPFLGPGTLAVSVGGLPVSSEQPVFALPGEGFGVDCRIRGSWLDSVAIAEATHVDSGRIGGRVAGWPEGAGAGRRFDAFRFCPVGCWDRLVFHRRWPFCRGRRL